jgi:ubiquinone/menaquinone biosynthesis C-methylase UbiE
LTGGYDDALFERLAEAEPHSFWYRSRARLIVDLVRRFFPQARDLLEVGSGSGGVLLALQRAFPELRLVGAEPSSQGIALARRRLPAEIELVEADVLALPYEEAFDVVGAFDVLEHVQDDDAALRALARATRRGGGVIVLVPQHPRLWSDMDRVAQHVRRYKRAELVQKARAAGLEVVYAGSFVSALLPAMIASRGARRLLRRAYDPVAELRPGPLNGVFERVLDAERRLIGRGISLPAGASLVVVARRTYS